MRQNSGFTLIELVIVIVMLASLAATAAPRFIDFGSDAKAAVMQGVAGAMNSGMKLVHSLAVIQGQVGENGTVQLPGYDTPIDVSFGYPIMNYNKNLDEELAKFLQWMDMEIYNSITVRKNKDDYPDDVLVLDRSNDLIGVDGRGIQIFFADASKAKRGWDFECVVQYHNATATKPARVTTYLDAC